MRVLPKWAFSNCLNFKMFLSAEMHLLPTKTVLLVEDEDNEVLLFQRACAKAAVSFAVEIVRDGQQAIAYLGGEGDYSDRQKFPQPDLILLDINMPVASGFEVLKWLREHIAYKFVPVVMLTSSVDDADVRLAYELSANGYLVKPFKADARIEIVTVIERFWLGMNLAPLPPSELRAGGLDAETH